MAKRTKKETALTPEEKLQQALVPVEEQPYPVPANWCWTHLKDICDYIRAGGDKPEIVSEVETDDYRIPVVANGIVNDGIIGYTDTYNEKANTVTVSGRGTIGYSVLRTYSYYPVIRLIVLATNDSVTPVYLKFIFDYFEEKGTGSSIPQLTVPMIKDKYIPLPPLTEQQRIVARIESLFAKLDEVKEKAQAVVDGYEDRKAAILHKAFTGELTAKWRKEHGFEIANWKITRLEDCSTSIGDGLHGTPNYDNDGKYYFVNGNNFSDTIIEIKADTKTVNLSEYEKHKIKLYPDSTVFVSINGTLGKTAFYNSEPIILGKSACYVNTNKSLNKYFLRYYFTSKEFVDYANAMATGSTIKNLGLKAMRNMPLNLPSVAEQIEIVRILDELIRNLMIVLETAQSVLNQIDTMKKSILARAFRGELETNDPSDEPAIELLKRVLQEE